MWKILLPGYSSKFWSWQETTIAAHFTGGCTVQLRSSGLQMPDQILLLLPMWSFTLLLMANMGMCEQQKYCLISLVLTNPGYAPRGGEHSPISLNSIHFCRFFYLIILKFCLVYYGRDTSLQRKKRKSAETHFKDYNMIEILGKKCKKKIQLFAS